MPFGGKKPTYKELYNLVVEEATPFIKCWRHCQAYGKCSFANKDEQASCGLLVQFFRGYVRTTMPFWHNLGFEQYKKDYIQHTKCIGEVIHGMQQFIWKTMSAHSVEWNLGTHPHGNRFWAIRIMRFLAEYVSLYTSGLTEHEFEFRLIVEGDSEFVALRALALRLNSWAKSRRGPPIAPWIHDITNIHGCGNLNSLGLLLEHYRERRIEYFVLMDNHSSVPKPISRLVDKGLLDASGADWKILDHSFEESFPPRMIADAVSAVYPALAVTPATVVGWKRSGKPIGKQLEVAARNMAVKFNKKELAEELGKSLAEAYNAGTEVCRRVEFLGVLKKISKHCDALYKKHYLAE
jgi:hypothetical protein